MSDFEIAPLMEWIPEMSPRFEAPVHLAPLVALARARSSGAAPPRGQRHGAARQNGTAPALDCVAARAEPDHADRLRSYAARLAEKKSRKARELARRPAWLSPRTPRVAPTGYRRVRRGPLACGVEGALTGESADVAIVDDAHKTAPARRARCSGRPSTKWSNHTFITRCEPGASVIVCGARWHDDDLSGRLIAQAGRASCCRRSTTRAGALAVALQRRAAAAHPRGAGRVHVAKLYQQRPRPRAAGSCSATFAATTRCRTGSTTIGVDLAYSQKETSADYSVATVLAHAEGVIYVESAEPAFLRRLQA